MSRHPYQSLYSIARGLRCVTVVSWPLFTPIGAGDTASGADAVGTSSTVCPRATEAPTHSINAPNSTSPITPFILLLLLRRQPTAANTCLPPVVPRLAV